MDREQLADIVPTLGVTIASTRATSNPHMDDDPKSPMYHWTVTLTRGRATMTLAYSCGAAHREWVPRNEWRGVSPADYETATKCPPTKGGRGVVGGPETMWLAAMRKDWTRPTPPTLTDVMGCLCADASGYDSARTFEEWAGEYGYDTDSRKAESTYRTIGEQAKQLRHLLGDDYARCLAAEW